MCALGENISDKQLPYHENGKVTQLEISTYIRQVFRRALDRLITLQIVLFDTSGKIHLKSCDRENKENIYRLRNFLLEIVKKRRQ